MNWYVVLFLFMGQTPITYEYYFQPYLVESDCLTAAKAQAIAKQTPDNQRWVSGCIQS